MVLVFQVLLVSEAVVHLDFLLMLLGWVISDYSSVLVTFARSPKILATYRGKVIDQRDANPCKEGKALARRH